MTKTDGIIDDVTQLYIIESQKEFKTKKDIMTYWTNLGYYPEEDIGECIRDYLNYGEKGVLIDLFALIPTRMEVPSTGEIIKMCSLAHIGVWIYKYIDGKYIFDNYYSGDADWVDLSLSHLEKHPLTPLPANCRFKIINHDYVPK